jgi:hypothetical protein
MIVFCSPMITKDVTQKLRVDVCHQYAFGFLIGGKLSKAPYFLGSLLLTEESKQTL